jgi:hypothetical protein
VNRVPPDGQAGEQAWVGDPAEVEALAGYLLASGELDQWRLRTHFRRWPGEYHPEYRMWVQLGRPATPAQLPEALRGSSLPTSLYQLGQRSCHVHAGDRLRRGNAELITLLRWAGDLPAAIPEGALDEVLDQLTDEQLAVVARGDHSVAVYLAADFARWGWLPGRLRELAAEHGSSR